MAWIAAKAAKIDPLVAAYEEADAALDAILNADSSRPDYAEMGRRFAEADRASEALGCMRVAWPYPAAKGTELAAVRAQYCALGREVENVGCVERREMQCEEARIKREEFRRSICGYVCERHCCDGEIDCRECLVGRTVPRLDGFVSEYNCLI